MPKISSRLSSRHRRKPAAGHVFSRFGIWLGLISAAALLLRLGFCREMAAINGGHNAMLTPSAASDLATYMKLGRSIASGEFSGEFYYQPLYYALFLPLCYLVSGFSVWFTAIMQSVLGAAACYLCGATAARLFGKISGIAAALLCAISTPLILYTPFHQNETLQSFNIALLFYLCVRAVQKPAPWRWGAAGAMAGLTILTRGNAWCFVPGIIALGLWAGGRRTPFKKRALHMILFAVMTVAVQLPFIWHNSRTLGRLSGPSTAADAVLALGNTVEAPPGGRDPGLPAGPMEYPASYAAAMARSRAGESVAAQMYHWMCESPGAFFELQFRKLLLFWDYREIPNNVSLYGEGAQSAILTLLLPGRTAVVAGLALGGMLLILIWGCRFKHWRYWFLLYFIAAYWGATALFYILSRFRAPIMVLAAVAAGALAGWAVRRWKFSRGARREVLPKIMIMVLIGVWCSTSAYEFYRRFLERGIVAAVRPQGSEFVDESGARQHLDHGPLTFGGWRELSAGGGLSVSKSFAAPLVHGGEARFTVLSRRDGAVFTAECGSDIVTLVLKSGFNTVSFALPEASGEITLNIAANPDVMMLYDAQRDYSRSQLNGQHLPGEWVVRWLEYPKAW